MLSTGATYLYKALIVFGSYAAILAVSPNKLKGLCSATRLVIAPLSLWSSNVFICKSSEPRFQMYIRPPWSPVTSLYPSLLMHTAVILFLCVIVFFWFGSFIDTW